MSTGFIIGRLFILGHDACHQSFTAHRKLNSWLGRLVFMPSLTPYSLWAVGHNVVHHGYTNLRGFDFVLAPHTLQEFQSLPRWRQQLERLDTVAILHRGYVVEENVFPLAPKHADTPR